MGDLKEATDHLKPLDIPAQIGLYFPGMEGRLGVQVCVSFPLSQQILTWLCNRILPKHPSSAPNAVVSGTGWPPIFLFSGASVSSALSMMIKGCLSTSKTARALKEISLSALMESRVSVRDPTLYHFVHFFDTQFPM